MTHTIADDERHRMLTLADAASTLAHLLHRATDLPEVAAWHISIREIEGYLAPGGRDPETSVAAWAETLHDATVNTGLIVGQGFAHARGTYRDVDVKIWAFGEVPR